MRFRFERDYYIQSPGTGKTTYLIDLVKDHLIGGVTPKNIAFMSFSKKAATEAKARALRDLDLDSKDMIYFRTLHSLAFSWLGLSTVKLCLVVTTTSWEHWLV